MSAKLFAMNEQTNCDFQRNWALVKVQKHVSNDKSLLVSVLQSEH